MKRLIPILLTIFTLAACEKDPDMSNVDNEYLVYTNYDHQARFTDFSTYYVPDKILVIGNTDKPEYLEGEGAAKILAAYKSQMNARGYTEAPSKEVADLGIQVSYIKSTYYFNSYGNPEWWWGYPGYWGSGYWGNWGGGWYYPYAVNYSYSTNSFISELVNLKAPKGTSAQLPILWTSYMSGLAYSSTTNTTLAVKGVAQAFAQSPYLTNK